LPTPTCDDANQVKRDSGSFQSLIRTVHLLPTPRAIYGEHPGATDPRHLTGAALTSSPPAIPVNHSHSPGSAWARKMTATYGRRFADYWLTSNRADACLKMLLDTSVWASTTCYLTWKKSATPAGRLLFRLVPSTHRIGGTGSGLLQSPMPSDVDGGRTTKGKDRPNETGLRGQAIAGMLPTPTTFERPNEGSVRLLRAQIEAGSMTVEEATAILGKSPYEAQGIIPALLPTPRAEFDSGRHRGKADTLHSAVKMFPTPRANEHKDTGDLSNLPVNGYLARTVFQDEGKIPSLKLNSAWVSRMMGYPDDWLTLDG
jgi:hypothetical protein